MSIKKTKIFNYTIYSSGSITFSAFNLLKINIIFKNSNELKKRVFSSGESPVVFTENVM